jgi:hypothetical protein
MLHPIHLKVARLFAFFLCLVLTSACWWGRGGRDRRYEDRRGGREDHHDERR